MRKLIRWMMNYGESISNWNTFIKLATLAGDWVFSCIRALNTSSSRSCWSFSYNRLQIHRLCNWIDEKEFATITRALKVVRFDRPHQCTEKIHWINILSLYNISQKYASFNFLSTWPLQISTVYLDLKWCYIIITNPKISIGVSGEDQSL